MQRRFRFAVWASLAATFAVAPVGAEPPAISNIFPDFPVEGRGRHMPRIITGENLDAEGLRLVVWSPSADRAEIEAAVRDQDEPPAPPADPPARGTGASVLDREQRVVVARLGSGIVYAVSADGASQPYRVDAAKPYWISRTSAEPGERLHIFGQALQSDHGGPERYARKPAAWVAFKGKAGTWFAHPQRDARSSVWTADARLIYFHLPRDIEPGEYSVYVHNGRLGIYGWSKIGGFTIVPVNTTGPTVISVTDHGAKGDDLADDTEAVDKALAAAAKAVQAGKDVVVFFPAGLWRIGSTLAVPVGVTVRGAGRDATVIEGFGYDPHGGALCAVAALRDGTVLENLTLQGACGEGSRSNCLLTLTPTEGAREVTDVDIRGCRLTAMDEDLALRRNLYWGAIRFKHGRRINLLHNDIQGSIWYSRADRFEVVDNTIRGGVFSINVAIHGWTYDSLLCSNRFIDTPGRICFYPKRHTYIRFNEVHHSGRTAWANAGEVYLVHGLYGKEKKYVGRVTTATPDSLTDVHQQWTPGRMAETVVMIIAGKGFGQYREVTGNTSDTLRLDRSWRVTPDETSQYAVGPLHWESSFYANLNNTPMVMSIWFDTVANTVVRHRDLQSGGILLSGADESSMDKYGTPEHVNRFNPAWYNLIADGWTDGAPIAATAGGRADNATEGPAMFGNFIVGNRIRSPHLGRSGGDRQGFPEGGIRLGRLPRDPKKLQNRRVGSSHAIVSDNLIGFTDLGIIVGQYARKAFILGNTFQRVDEPILDYGAGTVIRGNSHRRAGQSGSGIAIPDRVNLRQITPIKPLAMGDFAVDDGGRTASAELAVPLACADSDPREYIVRWQEPANKHWQVTPAERTVSVPANGKAEAKFKLTFSGELDEVFPMPTYEVLVGGQALGELTQRVVPDLAGLARLRPPKATARRIAEPPAVDGSLDDPAWTDTSAWGRLLSPYASPEVRQGTEVRAVHDGRVLYLAIRCRGNARREEPAIHDGPRRDGDINWWSAIELFFDTDGKTGTDFYLVADAAGDSMDARDGDRKWDGPWRVAAGREKKAWTLEFAIPLEMLDVPAKPGAEMRMNVVRVHHLNTGERSMWSPVFHWATDVPERLGVLRLE